MSTIFCFSNHKGGVGKTTSSTNVAACLASLGLKILLIDLDPQANATISLGIKESPKNTVYEALKGTKRLIPIHIANNLDLVASSIDLAGAEFELISEMGREYILKKAIQELNTPYDYIIIDCPPSLGLLTTNALAAANLVFVPVQAEYLALTGLANLELIIHKVQRQINAGLQFGGAFITGFDKRNTLHGEIVKTVSSRFNDLLLKSVIRTNVALAEAPAVGNSILEYAPKSNGAADYLSLAKELHGRILSAGEPSKPSKPSKPNNTNTHGPVTPVIPVTP